VRTRGFIASVVALAVCLLSGGIALAAWSDPEDVSATGTTVQSPRVGADGGGNAVLAWVRQQPGLDYLAQARRRGADGSFGPVFTLSVSGQDASSPELAVNANGDAVIAWDRSDGSNARVQVRQWPAGGLPGPTRTVSASGQDAVDPHVGIDAAGNALIVWRRFDGSAFRMQVRGVAADGTLATTHSVSSPGVPTSNPEVTVNPSGGAALVWVEPSGGFTRVMHRPRSSTGTLGSTQTMSLDDDASDPKVAIDPAGDSITTWVQQVGTNQQVWARSRFASGALGPKKALPEIYWDGSTPQLAMRSDGVAFIVWRSPHLSSGYSEIQTRWFTINGGRGGGVIHLSPTGQPALHPQVAVDGSGLPTFVWENTLTNQVQARSLLPGLFYTPPVRNVSLSGPTALDPQTARGATGPAVVTWISDDHTYSQVESAVGP